MMCATSSPIPAIPAPPARSSRALRRQQGWAATAITAAGTVVSALAKGNSGSEVGDGVSTETELQKAVQTGAKGAGRRAQENALRHRQRIARQRRQFQQSIALQEAKQRRTLMLVGGAGVLVLAGTVYWVS